MSFDDLLLELQGQKASQKDPNQISLDELFNESFMKKHSNSNSFAEFLEKGNFQEVKVQEDIANIPDELFDRHVARDTKFADWKSMLKARTDQRPGSDCRNAGLCPFSVYETALAAPHQGFNVTMTFVTLAPPMPPLNLITLLEPGFRATRRLTLPV